MRGYIEAALRAQERAEEYPFAVIHLGSRRAIGSTRYHDVAAVDRGVEIGFRAKYLLLRHAFEAWGAIRVTLKTDARNERSQAAIRKLGARYEGTLRNHRIRRDGTYRDTVVFSIIASEGPGVRRRSRTASRRSAPRRRRPGLARILRRGRLVSAIRRLPAERTHTAVGIFPDEAAARAAMARLGEEGFGDDDVGLVETPRGAVDIPASRIPQGVAVGAVVGTILALLVALGPASGYLPEPRAIIVAIIASTGTVAGGLVGFYAGRYFPRRDPEVYQRRLDRGEVLVTVSCAASDRERARDTLRRAGATSIREEPSAQIP